MKNGENPSTSREPLSGGKATIYRKGVFGADRLEVSEFELSERVTGKLVLQYRQRRRRSTESLVLRLGSELVVLDGWAHPKHPIADPTPDGKGEITRYASYDPAWREDFNQFFGLYLANNPSVKVLADYRAARDAVRSSEIGRSGELDESAEAAF